MIHFSCDLCKRPISSEELRYVVRMEVYAACESVESDEVDGDRDYLQEVQEILQRAEDSENDQICDDVYQQMRFDVCPDCRRAFVKNPLGRSMPQLNFSQN